MSATNTKPSNLSERTFNVYYCRNFRSKAQDWMLRHPTWDAFKATMFDVKKSRETVAEYSQKTKAEKLAIKSSFGAYFCGKLNGNKRNKDAVTSKSIAVIDIDDTNGRKSLEICETFRDGNQGTAFICSVTHGHTTENPRLRIAVPLDRNVTPSEFVAVIRYLAWKGGILDIVDLTTFDIERCFFLSSLPIDGVEFKYDQEGSFANVDEILSTYDDYTNEDELPRAKDEIIKQVTSGKFPTNPREKEGLIGAFCRAFPISKVIERFLADTYRFEKEEGKWDRYSCLLGSSYGGLLVFKDMFAYAYQNHDKANNGHLNNAFDLLRLNTFDGDLTKALDFVAQLEEVKAEQINLDFGNLDADLSEAPKWFAALERNKKGIIPNIKNIRAILENDSNLKERIRKDAFSCYVVASEELPWLAKRNVTKAQVWEDDFYGDLAEYLEKYKLFKCDAVIKKAVTNVANDNPIHPVQDYLNSLEWDGISRIENAVIHYLGAENTALNRVITKLFFIAAVARILDKGCKYDYCFVLAGDEAIGKSSFFRILAGEDWYLDTPSIEGKDGMSQLRGRWIIELSELAGFSKSEIGYIKGFITRQTDVYRKAYGDKDIAYDRQCVLCGTTNESNFLRSQNGNRRFAIIDVDKRLRKDFTSTDAAMAALEEDREKLWGEAVYLYKNGDKKLFLASKFEALAKEVQMQHNERENDPTYTKLDLFLNALLPTNWDSLNTFERRSWWMGYEAKDDLTPIPRIVRTRVCAMEYLSEYFGYDGRDREYKRLAGNVNNWLSEKKDWCCIGRQRHPLYGNVKAFARVNNPSTNIEAKDVSSATAMSSATAINSDAATVTVTTPPGVESEEAEIL